LKIVVCVKQTADSAAKIVAENGKVSWGDTPLVINPWDEYAVEAALQQKEAVGGSVTALSVGGEEAKIALRHALAMGVDEARLVSDPAFAALDTQSVARLLAAAILKLGAVDLAIFGRQAIDDETAVTSAQTARLLGWSSLSLASKVAADGSSMRVERALEEGRQVLRAVLPAVVSVVKDIGEPRYPSFLNKRKADRAEIPSWSLSELSLPAPTPVVSRLEVMNPPVRAATCEFINGANPTDIAGQLAEKILAEKVL
jgi:electron transfer flavoprotein beta subunit